MPLLHQPGTHWRYAYGYDLLGAVLFKATGQTPDVWMKQVGGWVDVDGWVVSLLAFGVDEAGGWVGGWMSGFVARLWCGCVRGVLHSSHPSRAFTPPHSPPNPPPHHRQNVFDPLKMLSLPLTHHPPNSTPHHQQNVFDPLKMFDTGFNVPSEKINRYSSSYTKTALTGRLQFVFRPRCVCCVFCFLFFLFFWWGGRVSYRRLGIAN